MGWYLEDKESQLLPLLPATHTEGAGSRYTLLFLALRELLHGCGVNHSEDSNSDRTHRGRQWQAVSAQSQAPERTASAVVPAVLQIGSRR